MRLTERELRKLIREEILREGFMDTVKGALGMQSQKEPALFEKGDVSKVTDLIVKELQAAKDQNEYSSIRNTFAERDGNVEWDRISDEWGWDSGLGDFVSSKLAALEKNKKKPTKADAQILYAAMDAAMEKFPRWKSKVPTAWGNEEPSYPPGGKKK